MTSTMIITISPMINNRTITMISTISTMINSSSSTMISTGRLRELAHSGALCRLFPRVAGKEKHFKVLLFLAKTPKEIGTPIIRGSMSIIRCSVG